MASFRLPTSVLVDRHTAQAQNSANGGIISGFTADADYHITVLLARFYNTSIGGNLIAKRRTSVSIAGWSFGNSGTTECDFFRKATTTDLLYTSNNGIYAPFVNGANRPWCWTVLMHDGAAGAGAKVRLLVRPLHNNRWTEATWTVTDEGSGGYTANATNNLQIGNNYGFAGGSSNRAFAFFSHITTPAITVGHVQKILDQGDPSELAGVSQSCFYIGTRALLGAFTELGMIRGVSPSQAGTWSTDYSPNRGPVVRPRDYTEPLWAANDEEFVAAAGGSGNPWHYYHQQRLAQGA